MSLPACRLALVLTLGLALSPAARAGESTDHTTAYVGALFASTGIRNNPGFGDGGAGLTVPTFAMRQWDGPVNWGFEAEGAAAGIMNFLYLGTVSTRVIPLLGADVGFTFDLLGGRSSLNFVLDGVGIYGQGREGALYVDLGAQLHYTRLLRDDLRLNAYAQLAPSVTSNTAHNGTDVGLNVEAVYRISGVFSAFARLSPDLRVYKDEALEHKEYSVVTWMLRVGLALSRPAE